MKIKLNELIFTTAGIIIITLGVAFGAITFLATRDYLNTPQSLTIVLGVPIMFWIGGFKGLYDTVNKSKG